MLNRLVQRAEETGCSVSVLLASFLDDTSVQALRESQARLQALFEQSNDAVFLLDQHGKHLDANQKAVEMFGYSHEQLLNMTYFDMVHPDEVNHSINALQYMLSGERVPIYERLFRHQSGEVIPVEVNVEVVKDADGNFLHIQSILRDIRQRKRAEREQRQYQLYLRSIMDSQTAFMIRTDEQGYITYANRRFQEFYQERFPKVIGVLMSKTIMPDDEIQLNQTIQWCFTHPNDSYQLSLRQPDSNGDVIWTLWEFVYLREPNEQSGEMQCVGFDITEKVKAEEALRENETRYRLLTEMMSDYAISMRINTDGTLNIEWIVGAFETITGYRPDEVSTWSGNKVMHPDDKPLAQSQILLTRQGEPSVSEYRIRHKDGHYRWIRAHRTPIYDEREGRVVRFYSAVKDITEQKRVEHIQLEQDRLRLRLQKEKEMSAFIQKAVSSLSHDIRTPLSVIKTTKDLLSQYFDQLDESARRHKLESIEKQLYYVIQMMDDLNMTVRSGLDERDFQPEMTDIDTLCRLSIDEITSVSHDPPRLNFMNHTTITHVHADETLLTRILLNLLSNAVKYSLPDSDIFLELDQRDGWLVLRLTDQGIGISSRDLPRIYEPFYRVDDPHVRRVGGTGLGLNIVKDCVERHQGHIIVESEIGHGTIFTIELPYRPV
ncbi:MAG: PAS domain S-box protein [Anaerolineae bacterium]